MIADIPEKEHKGWFILLGISLLLSPFQISAYIFEIYDLISSNAWEDLITISSSHYIPNFQYLVLCELSFYILMLLAWIYIIYLFFTKNYKFPKIFIIISLTYLFFILVDTFVASLFLKDIAQNDTEIRIIAIYCLIWITYIKKSQRVKNTFVKKKPVE
ncbi:DUF2569 domain-containing protein [Pasteurella atlantica]|uniref:DUF2569 domain-containing protein n=2 Tax=Pasteurellaceae TaxID=712 RepID=A0ACC6HKB1_9PAST|nr:DUF2569 domain-containing protein [Pasteurella atlantica]MDP8051306.1 DUF2569 domain-containing protein [Pasteurella atlantica]MDP8104601.1 DUF2569 domain-containing protein [Pasteurella atlantica]MDP8147846.1 DUF2569 domain-containing protein [Pasteurella atlantica]